MENKKIIKAIQMVIIQDLHDFENASETCNSVDFACMVRDTASIYNPILSEDLSEKSLRAFEKTPPALLVRYRSELSEEIIDRIDEPENVRKLMRNLRQSSPGRAAGLRYSNLMVKMIQAIGEVIG